MIGKQETDESQKGASGTLSSPTPCYVSNCKIQMVCDSCVSQVCEPPELSQPHGAFYCACGHWGGTGSEEDMPTEDPWKHCEDYDPNI